MRTPLAVDPIISLDHPAFDPRGDNESSCAGAHFAFLDSSMKRSMLVGTSPEGARSQLNPL